MEKSSGFRGKAGAVGARRGDGERAAKAGPGVTGEPAGVLGVYLREAGRVPLLDSRREVELAADLDDARAGLRALAPRLARCLGRETYRRMRWRPRTDAEWHLEEIDRFYEDLVRHCGCRRDTVAAKLLADARRQKRMLDRARDRLIRANLRLVVHVAKKFGGSGMSLPDLVQEGNLGLIKAVDRFDHRRGNRFSTYAYWWIKQAIERAIGNQARTVRVPMHVQEKVRTVRRAADALRGRRQREPTVEEIAGETGLSVATIRTVVASTRGADPLEDPERPIDHLRKSPDPNAVSPFERVWSSQWRRGIAAVLQGLTPEERRVIGLRFGPGREAHATLDAVGRRLSLSSERVRQIERRALEKLRTIPCPPRLRRAGEPG